MLKDKKSISIIIGLVKTEVIAEHDAVEQIEDLCRGNSRSGFLIGAGTVLLIVLIISFFI